MNKIKNFLLGLDFKTLLILGLVIMLLVTRMYSPGNSTTPPTMKVDGKKYEVLKHTIDTVFITKKTTQYRPGAIIYKEAKVEGIVPPDVDKDSITKDYYSTTVYKDTLKLKNNQGYVSITDSISQNMIVGRLWDAHIISSIITDKTILKELPRTQIYLGGVLGFNSMDLINFAGPSIILKTKKDRIYSLGLFIGK